MPSLYRPQRQRQPRQARPGRRIGSGSRCCAPSNSGLARPGDDPSRSTPTQRGPPASLRDFGHGGCRSRMHRLGTSSGDTALAHRAQTGARRGGGAVVRGCKRETGFATARNWRARRRSVAAPTDESRSESMSGISCTTSGLARSASAPATLFARLRLQFLPSVAFRSRPRAAPGDVLLIPKSIPSARSAPARSARKAHKTAEKRGSAVAIAALGATLTRELPRPRKACRLFRAACHAFAGFRSSVYSSYCFACSRSIPSCARAPAGGTLDWEACGHDGEVELAESERCSRELGEAPCCIVVGTA